MGNTLRSAARFYFGDGKTAGGEDKDRSCDNKQENMSQNEGNLTSVEAITKKLAEVTNLAEQLDQALSLAQSSEGSSALVTPIIKKILDGTASTSPEEWYSNLKSTSLKTPNTSSDSKSEDEFVTASECTCTPPSRSSSFQTASEGGAISPWWELDAPSDTEGKPKESVQSVKKLVKSPVRIGNEIADVVVHEAPDIKDEKLQSENQGMTSFVLENSAKLLRPDMTQPITHQQSHSSDSCVNEIVRNLSQIVKNNESYSTEVPIQPEKITKPTATPDCKCDGETSSQYSLELLTADLSSELPQSHSKSQSFETDNTDMSLPKFHGDIPSSVQPEIPKFDDQPKPELKPHFTRRDFSFPQNLITDESSKIYIIDASTPSPKSKRYVDSSLDSLEYYQQPIRKIVEAEIHHQEEKAKADLTEEEFTGKVKEVRDRRRPVITIDLQGACALPPDYYYQSQITKMAIKGVF